MPPRTFSRYSLTAAYTDPFSGALALTDPEPFPYAPFSDNRQHVVVDGDTLWNLAARYFTPLPKANDLWWIIADFQPDPIVDPTLVLEAGRVIIIPSIQTVQEHVFDEQRRDV